MKNLNNIVDKIEKSIDDKDKIREKALRLSREIIINCRKSIQSIHQNLMKDAKSNIKKASDKLEVLYGITKEHPDLYHAGFVENAAQELVEAHCLYNIMNGKDLPDPDEIKTTYSSYLLGLCDLVGELRRTALDSIRKGKAKKADENLNMMEEIYDVIIRFDYPSGLIPIKKKQDMVRGLIERTRGELAVASCERRIEYHTGEFRGMLDRVSENKKKTKDIKKDSENDLDIDGVW
ncbi:MAG: RNA-binding protein [Thermoplasmatales archaeon SG8-52-3]|nr:MAG: RNA-binding protein [Thermoplasmatales archaeon SG8-52-3]